jgi:NTE family protein
MSQTRGVALALSSGGARGLVHVGVLKVLDRHHVPIVGIAGSSMGALIGALYGSGYSGGELEQMAQTIRRAHYMDVSVSKMGLLAGRKLHELVLKWTHGKNLEDLVPPLKVVAVDIERAEEVVISRGSVADAVRASASIPGMFSPVRRGEHLLVDGGVLNRVPANLAREFPCQGVIAVDAGIDLASRMTSMFDVLFQTFDIMARELRRYQTISAEVLIQPALDLTRDNHRAQRFIAAGEAACEAHLPEIMRLLETDSDSNHRPECLANQEP